MVEIVMTVLRTILLALLVAPVAASAAPLATDSPVDPLQLTEPSARKGTRSYRAGEATAADDTQTKTDGISDAEKLSQCMDTWDTGTHITKSKWREICKRQLKDQ